MAKTVPMKGALSANSHRYEAEDGTAIYDSGDEYKSASAASRGLDNLIKSATRVVKQGTKKDGKGRITGRRVELSFSHGRGAKPEIVIAWTDGPWVERLSSTSLPLLLDFESQYP
ncbi:MAG TPA: hypothetical protein VGS20_07265 [Candidatus Acidoferrales bacterium]|nr:hypothetical protein [Candidatus Acidoferrales bacterium]